MTKEEIKNYLDDFRTDPIEVNATCKYNIPAFKEITYRVIFYCTELDIKWDSKGVILDVGFDCSVFELFRECKLDVDELVEEMDGIISRVPSARSDLKDFLRHFDDVDHSFEIDFVNLEWREAYEFCAADDVMHVSVNFKPEVNFILQWTSAKYVISLEIAGDSREYSLCKVPGKKGTYYFGSVGQEVRSILEKLSMFYSQFGFSFDEFINDITETCENGKSYGVRILKDTDSPWASNSAIHQLAHDEDDEEDEEVEDTEDEE